jgi:hypothetical protein
MCRCLMPLTVLTIAMSSVLLAADQDVAALLSRQIIDANLPMQEVQAYTEGRIPPMPESSTVTEWEEHADRMRRETLEKVVFRGEAAKWRTAKTQVEWFDTIEGGPEYRIKKLRYEALPGLWIPALLYEPKTLEGKVPVVMNVNGHDRNGKVADYKQVRCINQAKRGMLALNVEWLGMGQLNTPGFVHYRMNQLNLCGTSGLAPFYLSMKRGIDLLLSHEHADPKRVAVAGLSGGGWQTIFISSLDTRVVLSDPVAGYSSFRTRARHLSDLGDSEQTPCDLATVTDYAQLTAMRAPRPTLLTFNSKDNCCFASGHALPPLLEAAQPVFALYGKPENLESHVNEDPGTHNFLQDNRQALYRMIGKHFFAGQEFDANEIPCDSEIKSKEDFEVPLPKDNADFHSLALSLSKNLPRNTEVPTDGEERRKWCRINREQLKQIVRAKDYDVKAEEVDTESTADVSDDTTVSTRSWRLRIGGVWTVPAVELAGKNTAGTVLLIADGGRKSVPNETEALLKSGHRVLAIDPFYFGESKIAQRDFLFALLVSATGDRPLGLQASQLAATSRWLVQSREQNPIKIVAVGPRSSLIAMVAAALETEAIAEIELRNSYASLRDIITENKTVQEAPELFCFGLFERFDIPQLKALVSPRTVHFAP